MNKKHAILALVIIAVFSSAAWIFTTYIRPILNPSISSGLLIFSTTIISVATFIAAYKDIVELLSNMSNSRRRNGDRNETQVINNRSNEFDWSQNQPSNLGVNDGFNKLKTLLEGNEDVIALSTAVHNTEAMYSEGKVPKEISDLLYSARAALRSMRKSSGEEETQLRVSQLEDIVSLRNSIQRAAGQGESTFIDPSTGDETKIDELLEQLDNICIEYSRKTSERFHAIANSTSRDYPYYAASKLREALRLPLTVQDQELLRKTLANIEENTRKRAIVFIDEELNPKERELARYIILTNASPRIIARNMQISESEVNILSDKLISKFGNYFTVTRPDMLSFKTVLDGLFEDDDYPQKRKWIS